MKIKIKSTASASAIMIIIGGDHRKQEPKRRNITKNGPKNHLMWKFLPFPPPPTLQLPQMPVHARRPPLSRALAPV